VNIDSFWDNVSLTDDDRCWLWRGGTDGHGYGCLRLLGRTAAAHRVAWMLQNGPVPAGCGVLHHCDQPKCVRPEHLYAGTQGDNMRDMVAHGRANPWGRYAMHCKHGHVFDEENTRINRKGARCCRKCERRHCRRYYWRTEHASQAPARSRIGRPRLPT